MPELIDPLHLAEKRAELKGQLFLSGLDRLTDLLFDDSGVAFVDMSFSKEGRVAAVQGRIVAKLNLICQNCAQQVNLTVQSHFKLGAVSTISQADRLPTDFEPLLCAEGQKFPLKDIVEDELLLALPTFPKHDHPCFASEFMKDKAVLSEECGSNGSTDNPFAILAKLKNTGDT